MEIYFIVSIFAITGVFYLLRRFTSVKVCAVCAGAAGTWILAIIARFLGYPVNETLTAVLMGGSVVGIMYQLEKHSGGSVHVFKKTFFMVSGFFAVYGLLSYQLGIFAGGLLGATIAYMFFWPAATATDKTKEIEKRMAEHCCD